MDMAQILKQFNIDPMQAQQAWKAAQQMGAGVQTKEQALKLLASKGIDYNALKKMSAYINHPLAGMAAQMAGVNIEKVRKDFDNLINTGAGTNKITPAVKGGDILSKYKQGYKQL